MNSDIPERMYLHRLVTGANYGLTKPYLEKEGDLLTEKNYLSSGESTADRMLSSKLDRSDKRIEAIIEAIDKRRLIKEENFYGIERGLCTCQNLLFDMGYKVYRRDRDWIRSGNPEDRPRTGPERRA